MFCWDFRLVIYSCMIISSVANSIYSNDLKKCSGGHCAQKDLCPNGMYDGKHEKENHIPLPVEGNKGCQAEEVYVNEEASVLNFEPDPVTSPTDPADSGEDIEIPALNMECGQFNENGLEIDILNNNDSLAQYGEFPWVVYIMSGEKQNPSPASSNFVCGGTLIHPRFVVTTAHNTDGKSNLIARFGEWDISTTKEPYPHKDIRVTEIIKHPDYVYNPIQNDIALLWLAESVQYQKHIQPICLPQPNDQFVAKRCISNGWGKQRGVYANVMKKITLPVITNNECTRMLRLAKLGPFFFLRHGFICAGGEAGVDMCKGDGGSPLACQTDTGAFVLAGIVSWGIGCEGHNAPGVYVAVNHYVDWINEYLTKHSKNIGIKL